MKRVYILSTTAIMINMAIHFGAISMTENIKKVGKLYKVNNGYYSILADEEISHGGSWLMNIKTSSAKFFPEGTPVLIVEWKQNEKPIVLAGDCLYWIDPNFFEEM